MKIYSPPAEVELPVIDYRNYNRDVALKQENEYRDKLKARLFLNGYRGKLTGEIYTHPMGDGYAEYMIADNGKKQVLVHIPLGDAWDHPDVRYLPIKVILARIEGRKKMQAIFAKHK